MYQKMEKLFKLFNKIGCKIKARSVEKMTKKKGWRINQGIMGSVAISKITPGFNSGRQNSRERCTVLTSPKIGRNRSTVGVFSS